MQINYCTNEHMIRLQKKEHGANSYSDEWLGGMNREVLIKANTVS